MNRTSAMTLGVAAVVLGIVSAAAVPATSTQQVRPEVILDGSAPDVFIRQRPAVGSTLWFRGTNGHSECTVAAVIKEWVQCDAHPAWRNLYTGAAYSVVQK